MARNGLFARALLVALLMIQFAAVPVFAQDAAEAEATEEEGGLNYEGIMNTSDSLAWSTSDSLDEMVVVPEKASGFMGLFERTALGKSGAGKLFVAGGNFMIFLLIPPHRRHRGARDHHRARVDAGQGPHQHAPPHRDRDHHDPQ
jgi:hypothetical protein